MRPHSFSAMYAALALAASRAPDDVYDLMATRTTNLPEPEGPDAVTSIVALTSRQVRRQLERKERKRRKLK